MDKTQRYDRQLRLWKAHGQARLEAARVCLLQATAVGSEVLKNLVLPGVGGFTIVDDQAVAPSDLGQNFFVTTQEVGQLRARVVTRHLKELNEDVQGQAVVEDPFTFAQTNAEALLAHSIVVATNFPCAHLLPLAALCWEHRIALVVANTAGFMGYIRVQVPEHTMFETHSNQSHDLRLDCPFPALHTFADSFNVDCQDSMAHGNIPSIVLLLHFLKRWRDKHPTQTALTYKDKKEIKSMIEQAVRNPNEENFEEAAQNAVQTLHKTETPDQVKRVFEHRSCKNLHASLNPAPFWILTRALADFVQEDPNGLLPLAGSIPDMKTDTQTFVQLQALYFEKAEEDVCKVRHHVSRLLTELDLPPNTVPDDDIRLACKNAVNLRVQWGTSIASERNKTLATDDLAVEDNFLWYLAFQTHTLYTGRDPVTSETVEHEVEQLLGKLDNSTSQQLRAHPEPLSSRVHYTLNHGDTELHNLAAWVGGVVAQEVVKLITHQYVPLANTLVVNGVDSTTQSFSL
ncbi:hypothetical protein H4R34_002099 [Dimargaris verticillata]|uniref:NEDD8-activating enzyme E1 regulatory subunit n=1 Tax=Dimargaris verticillata TaxID=2761393 RepID=A0A9W8B366_9FUNG|nr:hypothetical protein H4R34_002099 [Dimargaris verticillata]